MKYEAIIWESTDDLGVKRYDIVETYSNGLQYIRKYTGKTMEDALNIFKKHEKVDINNIGRDVKNLFCLGMLSLLLKQSRFWNRDFRNFLFNSA